MAEPVPSHKEPAWITVVSASVIPGVNTNADASAPSAKILLVIQIAFFDW
jgi:hypothetical protein